MKYCKICLQSDTRPGIYFDENGICPACNYHNSLVDVDWDDRNKELADIVEKLDPVPSKMVNGFLKASDINNFENYKSVMSQIKIKKILPSPADMKTASFYMSASVSPVNEQRFN